MKETASKGAGEDAARPSHGTCGVAPGDRPQCCGPANSAAAGRHDADRFTDGWVDTPVGPVRRVKTQLDAADVLGRWQMRWGIGRHRYVVAPGLYAVGSPDAHAPVLVTANYKMTFDALRVSLSGLDVWVLVLDTNGINVWCAAGKGTFGTDELARRVHLTRLREVVRHRKLVLPQLAGPGVSAHRVRKECGFSVIYGPVRAADLTAFLAAGRKASPQMRRVTFAALERLVLTPVELMAALKPSLWVALALFALAGVGRAVFSPADAWQRGLGALAVYLAGIVAGALVTPLLLPWLPSRAFSAKGAFVGAIGASFAVITWWSTMGKLQVLAVLLGLPAIASFVAMNFTGATPFTSPSGVEKEMRRAMPVQALAAALALSAWVGSAFAR